MGWTPETNLEIAHALHRVAWARADAAAPRYVEADRRLRRGAGQVTAEPPQPGRATLVDALTAERRVAWDRQWFDLRWTAGEEEAMKEAAQRIAAEAAEIPHGGLLKDPWTVVASPVLAGTAVACAVVQRVGIGPRGHGVLAVLTAVAAKLGAALQVEQLEAAERRCLLVHCAASAVLTATDDDEALSSWIAQAVAALLPLPADRDAYSKMVRRIAAECLDQPPGEIERIADGLGRAQATRLLRAWRRGFFVPANFDLRAWCDLNT